MDSTTYNALKSRVDKVDLYTGESKSLSIYTELASLAKQVDHVYREHPQFQSLYDIITKLDIWDRLSPSKQQDTKSTTTSDEEQLQMLSLKLPAAVQALNTLAELSTMDVTKIINSVSFAQMRSENMNQVTQLALLKEQQAQEVANFFHRLVLKSLIVLERYAQAIENENRFWIQVEEKISNMGLKIDRHNKDLSLYNKY